MIRPVLHGVSVDDKDLRGWVPDDPDVVAFDQEFDFVRWTPR